MKSRFLSDESELPVYLEVVAARSCKYVTIEILVSFWGVPVGSLCVLDTCADD